MFGRGRERERERSIKVLEVIVTYGAPPVSCIITVSILHFKVHTTYCLRLSMATGA